MSWPKGRARPKKVGSTQVEPVIEQEIPEPADDLSADSWLPVSAEVKIPPDWTKGSLLNVRNFGPFYAVTLLHEEYSPEREERALKFTNPGELQDWVSRWYAPESYNPLAR